MILFGHANDTVEKLIANVEVSKRDFFLWRNIDPTYDSGNHYLNTRYYNWANDATLYAFTAGCWFATVEAADRVMLAERDTLVNAGNERWQLHMESDGTISLRIYNGTSTLRLHYQSSSSYNDGQPHHVVGTWSGGVSITNGTFASDTAWTKGTGWTIGSGVASKSAGTASYLETSSSVAFRPRQTYRINFTTSGRTAGTITPVIRGDSGAYESAGSAVSTNAAQQIDVTVIGPESDSYTLGFYADSSFDGDIDDVSVPDIVDIYVDGVSDSSQQSHTDQQSIPTATTPITVAGRLNLTGANCWRGLLRSPTFFRKWCDSALATTLSSNNGDDSLGVLVPIAFMRSWVKNY